MFEIVDDGDMQWLSDGAAIFPVPDLTRITMNMLITLFDITDKQVDRCKWSRISGEELIACGISLADNEDGDVYLEELPFTLNACGRTLQPLWAPGRGISLLVDTSELSPIEKYDRREFYARRKQNSGWMIVVKNGYQIIAAILPWRTSTDTEKQMLEQFHSAIGGVLKGASVDADTEDIL